MHRLRPYAMPLALLGALALAVPTARANVGKWHAPGDRAILLVPHLSHKNVLVVVSRIHPGKSLPDVPVDFSQSARPRILVDRGDLVKFKVPGAMPGGDPVTWSEVGFDIATVKPGLDFDFTGSVEADKSLGSIKLRRVLQDAALAQSVPDSEAAMPSLEDESWLGGQLSITSSASGLAGAGPSFWFRRGRTSQESADVALERQGSTLLSQPLLAGDKPAASGVTEALAMTCEPGPDLDQEKLEFVMVESDEWRLVEQGPDTETGSVSDLDHQPGPGKKKAAGFGDDRCCVVL